jgi:phosphatidylglycerol---prolipoprotein diacylglyceryl transferase
VLSPIWGANLKGASRNLLTLTIRPIKPAAMIALSALAFPNVSPEIFTISLFGMEFALRWYALAYITGIALGWWMIAKSLKQPAFWPANSAPMTAKQLEDLMTWIIAGVILGGRFGYVLFYRFSYYAQNPLEVLQVWEGGMSFHGGFLGVIVATYLYSRHQKLPLGSVADCLAMVAPLGLLLGRLANFINGELWGRVSDVPWAVVFPSEAAQQCLLPICARHPSQLYEAAMEGVILGLIMLWLVLRAGALKRPWTLAGTFFAGYGVSRFIVEFFRQPDAQFISEGNPLGLAFHVNGWGLTMGQTLSLPMILIGLVLIARAKRA